MRSQGTLTPAGSAVVLQLYGGAVRSAVHVDRDLVRLQSGLLGETGGAETLQTEPCSEDMKEKVR